jgi:hypothetical protein
MDFWVLGKRGEKAAGTGFQSPPHRKEKLHLGSVDRLPGRILPSPSSQSLATFSSFLEMSHQPRHWWFFGTNLHSVLSGRAVASGDRYSQAEQSPDNKKGTLCVFVE